ncbi:MAG: hypothetical protein JNG89_19910 [Planctomycetaceae bacterium]|nr:hypothetical protein [Planctomycetaceae bacterium]
MVSREGSSAKYSSDWSIDIPKIPGCTTVAPVECRIAQTMQDRMAAFGLVYDKYLGKGMLPTNPYRMRVIEHHLLPTTTVFVAVRDGEVVATVTLIGDGEIGLPMDGIHPEVTHAVRLQQLYVGEVSCLAFKKQEMKYVLPIFIELTQLMSQFARANGMHQFLIGCVPQHARFYCRFLGFEQIGQVRPYPTVCNTLGVACCLDFARIDRERPDCYDKYFGHQLPAAKLATTPMSPFERDAFGQVIQKSEQQLLQMV